MVHRRVCVGDDELTINYTLAQLQQACDAIGYTLEVSNEEEEAITLYNHDDSLFFSKDQAGINDAMDIIAQDTETLAKMRKTR